jgi:drug/metabolite transporter (DMT)-like permease
MDQQAILAAVVGLGSACGFAVSNALQHRAAGGVPRVASGPIRVLVHLTHSSWWLAGTALSFLAMLLHATALRWGSIAFVQPLMLVGVVLAVPFRAALGRTLPGRREVVAVAVTVVGLATLLFSVTLAPGEATPRGDVAIVLALLGLALAVAAVAVGRRWLHGHDQWHASLLGATAGCLFGITAGLLKLIGGELGTPEARSGALPLLVVALVGIGILGTAINQRAYQIAPLAFSMPVVNVVDVLVAIGFGALVFGEVPGRGPGGMAVELLPLATLALGLREIARLAPAARDPLVPCRPRLAEATR